MTRTLSTCALLLLVAAAASAETIYLKGGAVMHGKVTARTATELTLEIPQTGGNAQVTLPLARVRRIAPDGETPEQMTELGLAELRKGNAGAALTLFDDALSARQTHIPARIGRALAAGSQGNVKGAIAELRRSLLLAPNDPNIWYHLGVFLARSGRYNDAARSLDRALRLQPDPGLARRIRAVLGQLRQAARAAAVKAAAPARAARASFDSQLGNNAEAAAAGMVLQAMLNNLATPVASTDADLFVELKAFGADQAAFAAGGEVLRYRLSVRIAQVSMVIRPAAWASLTAREKRELVGGWVRYLKDVYPLAQTISIVSDGQRYLVEAIWNDLQEQVRFHWHPGGKGQRRR